MAKIYNLAGDDEIITFNIGDFSLDVSLSDAKSEILVEKAKELKEKSQHINDDNEWQARKEVKELLDDVFTAMFDADAPQKIYESAGENTISYLKIFLQISGAVQDEQEAKLNDETFKKYLAE